MVRGAPIMALLAASAMVASCSNKSNTPTAQSPAPSGFEERLRRMKEIGGAPPQPSPHLPAQTSWQSSMPPLEALELSDSEESAIISSIVSFEPPDACGDQPGCIGQMDFRAEYIDLGEGVKNGLAVRGNSGPPGRTIFCGATGNCATWFFRKVANQWNLIIGKPPDRAIESSPKMGCDNSNTCEPVPWPAEFSLLESRSNGLKDIVMATNAGGAGNLSYAVWEFNGTRYILNTSRNPPILLH